LPAHLGADGFWSVNELTSSAVTRRAALLAAAEWGMLASEKTGASHDQTTACAPAVRRLFSVVASRVLFWLEPIPNRLGLCYPAVMPTVLRFDGLRVVIYPADHRPAHVHVIGAGGEAVFNLHCPSGPPELRESHLFGQHEVNRIQGALASQIGILCEEWRKIHGSD